LNREIDIILFKNIPKLSRIYYQTPGNIDNLKGVNTKMPGITVPKIDTHEFFIPDEFFH